jgi:hypothetical protein
MLDTRIVLSGLWVATMLTFLWGDVLTMFAGDLTAGEIGGMKPNQAMWVGIAALMLIPIVMVVLSLTLPYPAIRWASIVAAIFWVIFNLFALSGYPAYEKFLIIVSFVFNGMIIWYAWKWVV